MAKTFTNSRNPILPPEYHTPDCEAHVMPDGRLYIYGSYDQIPNVYCSDEYIVTSTSDMKEWQISDVSFRGEQAPWFGDPNATHYPGGMDWSKPTPFMQAQMEKDRKKREEEQAKRVAAGLPAEEPKRPKFSGKMPAFLYAPDAIHKDGSYYLYFCMPDQSEGVAVADNPNGPFTDVSRMTCDGIDPAIFIDDDGQAYYYWGQFSARGGKLADDMRTLQMDTVVEGLVTEEEHFFHEGSSMRKCGDTYYMVYADMERGKPTSIGYATSKSPLGPFTYGGIIVDNDGCDPQSWNNHGSIECFNGQWYVFYHRSSRNSQCARRLCIEPITLLPDGSIPEVPMTSQGVGEPFAPGESIPAYTACGLTGNAYLDMVPENETDSYQKHLTSIAEGDSAIFRYVASDHDYTGVEAVATGSGLIRLFLDEQEAGYVTIVGGQVTQSSLAAPAGQYTLKLVFENVDGLELDTITLF